MCVRKFWGALRDMFLDSRDQKKAGGGYVSNKGRGALADESVSVLLLLLLPAVAAADLRVSP